MHLSFTKSTLSPKSLYCTCGVTVYVRQRALPL